MRKLKTAKQIALLKANGCKLKPDPMHEFRWSRLHRMMKRYSKLRRYLHLLDRDREAHKYLLYHTPPDDARRFPIVNFIRTPSEHCVIVDLLEDMELLHCLIKRLQEADLTLVTA
ncbi:hypothetical protein JG688_00016433 [Phytophthora aleatoria]|uniref:Uncharacterized protein n=1 Tax=Phytophthora aleatoria TaxID=2496075 RepID=A0A8J5ICE1_9STRA|nr:hypothetical protein JG688_00016433 [Phytophthora aleatoria]